MADVKRCDQTGQIADTMNPDGWLKISLQPYGIGQQQVLAGDVASPDAALEWLMAKLDELAAASSTVPLSVTVVKKTAEVTADANVLP